MRNRNPAWRWLTACAILAAVSTACEQAQQPNGPDEQQGVDLSTKSEIPPDLIVVGPTPSWALQDAGIASTPPIWEADFGTSLSPDPIVFDDGKFVSLGFTFEFYGVEYTDVWINANGNLTFNAQNTSFNTPQIPDGDFIMIAPIYGDFDADFDGPGAVHMNVLGTAPNRRFVATWSNMNEFLDPETETNTFQVQLFEGSDAIVFGYNGLSTDGINWATSPGIDPDMEVGLSDGSGSFIRSARGAEIPALDGTNICYLPEGGDYTEIKPCEEAPGDGDPGEIEVVIDIKPGSERNPINLRSRGVIPVAILTTSEFDATTVDGTTVEFGPDGAPPAHQRRGRAGHIEDVNGDGDDDLMLHFWTQETGIERDATEACLAGETFDGVVITGCDNITIVGRGRGRGR